MTRLRGLDSGRDVGQRAPVARGITSFVALALGLGSVVVHGAALQDLPEAAQPVHPQEAAPRETATVDGWIGGDWSGAIDEADGGRTELRLTLESSPEGPGAVITLGDAPPVRIEPEELSAERLRLILPFEALGAELELRPTTTPGQVEGSIVRPVAGPPATDIYLARIDRTADTWRLEGLRNLTDRDAYDNQPRFTRDGATLLYTASYDDQTEINLYYLASEEVRRLTRTPESEYSATPLPGLAAAGFSTVRTGLDGTQRLWAWQPAEAGTGEEADGEWTPSLLLPQVEPVGYHGWIDDDTAALFVLGEPPTLQLARVPREGELASPSRLLAAHVGRSIHKVPGRNAVSFVFKEKEDRWWIRTVDLETLETRSLLETPPGNEDFIWLRDGRLLSATGATLVIADPSQEFPQWTPVLDLETAGLGILSRLAEHPSEELLAVVAERPEDPTRQTARPVVLTRVDSGPDER